MSEICVGEKAITQLFLLQGRDDQTIFTARLFPIFHASEIVGLKEILWLQGELNDHEGRILKR